jgi:hypothetical protein
VSQRYSPHPHKSVNSGGTSLVPPRFRKPSGSRFGRGTDFRAGGVHFLKAERGSMASYWATQLPVCRIVKPLRRTRTVDRLPYHERGPDSASRSSGKVLSYWRTDSRLLGKALGAASAIGRKGLNHAVPATSGDWIGPRRSPVRVRLAPSKTAANRWFSYWEERRRTSRRSVHQMDSGVPRSTETRATTTASPRRLEQIVGGGTTHTRVAVRTARTDGPTGEETPAVRTRRDRDQRPTT